MILVLVIAILVSGMAFAALDREMTVSEIEAENPAVFETLDMTDLAAEEEKRIEEAPVTYESFGEFPSEEMRLFCIHVIEPEDLKLHDFSVINVDDWAPYEKEASITFETEGGYSKEYPVAGAFGVYDPEEGAYKWFAKMGEVLDGEHVRFSLLNEEMQALTDQDDTAVAILTTSRGEGGASASSTPSKQLESSSRAIADDDFNINLIANRKPVIDECAKMYNKISLGKAPFEHFPEATQQQIASQLPNDVKPEELKLTEAGTVQVTDYKPEFGDQTVDFEFITDYEKDDPIELVFGFWDNADSDVDWVVQPATIVDGDVHNRVQTELSTDLITRIQDANTTGLFVLAKK